jgi:choline/glycine/proline betaine transport protein
LQQVIIVVGLPFFVLGYLMIYSLLRALKEDAGEVPPLRTKRWRRVLPPEEVERRAVGNGASGTTESGQPAVDTAAGPGDGPSGRRTAPGLAG